MAIATGILLFVAAPWFRLTRRNMQRNKLEEWYALGPKFGIDIFEPQSASCQFCGSTSLTKLLIGSYAQKKLLIKINYQELDERIFTSVAALNAGHLFIRKKLI